jgi:hypothetical protein
METYEAKGFFPEREIRRARRPRAMGDVPLDPSNALTRRMATWMSMSVAVFTPIFAISVIFGRISLKASLEIVFSAGSSVLACAALLGALSLRRAIRRASHPLI